MKNIGWACCTCENDDKCVGKRWKQIARWYICVLCSFTLTFGQWKQIERRNGPVLLPSHVAIIEERYCDQVQLAV